MGGLVLSGSPHSRLPSLTRKSIEDGMAENRSAHGGMFEAMEAFVKRRQREALDFRQQTTARAHQAYGDAIRSGRDLVLRTQSEVNRFGTTLTQAPVRKVPGDTKSTGGASRTGPRSPTAPAAASRSPVRQGVDQALAVARGAQDAFTFGLGDRAYAGGRALIDATHGADLAEAWEARTANEGARDAYDHEHYATARIVGQVAGTGAQVLALGPAEGLVAGGARIAQATPLIARELGALGGAGAITGIGGQVITDASRGRLGTAGDYGGAAIGGVVGALTARGGAGGRAGAAMGAATSLAQDALNGQMSAASVDRARDAALAGGVLGAAGGAAGRYASDKLSRTEKELLGEDVSRLRTWLRGDKTKPGPKTAEKVPGGRTIPDQRSIRDGVDREIIESKFGRYAKLTNRQRAAYSALSNYRVDHSLPRDVGVALGLPWAELGYRGYADDR